MLRIKFIALLVLVYLSESIESLKTLNKSHYVINDRNSSIDFRVKDGRIVYGLCDVHVNGMQERMCRLVVEKSANKNDSYSCDLRLKTNGTIGPNFIIGGLDKDKVLLVWEDKSKKKYLRSNIVHMKDCKESKNKISFDRDRSFKDNTVLLYDNSYDVFFRNSKICGTKLCKVTLSADNKVVNGPVGYLEDPNTWHSLRRVVANSSDKGYLYVKRDVNDTSFFIIENDGSAKFLRRVPNKPKISLSTSHDFIGTCYTQKNESEKVTCAQYDASGNLKFETTALSDASDETQLLYMHNLPQGGMLLVLRECDEKNCRKNTCRHVILTKYDAKGKKVGSKIQEDRRGGWMAFYENEKNHYCLFKARGYINTPIAMGKQRLRVTYKCFEDADFVQ